MEGRSLKIVSVDTCTVSCGDIDFSALGELGEVTFYDVLSAGGLIHAAENADALLVNKASVDEKLISSCKNLRYVGTYSTGYNNIDLDACAKAGITVCNVPGYSTHAVSQHVFALLLSFVGEIQKYGSSVARGDWKRAKTFCYMPWQTREIYGKTFGIYGFGNIGRATARIAEAFGMRVIVHTRTRPEDCPYELVSAEEIFAQSDFLSLHCPLNDKTRGIVNEQSIALMKREAIIINTARGGLIDEVALAKALNSGRISGACLDVLTDEPMRKDCPLIKAKNVLITPHIAWIPRETRQRLVGEVADNLACFIAGSPRNRIV